MLRFGNHKDAARAVDPIGVVGINGFLFIKTASSELDITICEHTKI